MSPRLGSRAAVGLLLAAMVSVCSGQILPATPESAATVVSLQGQVSVLRDTGPWALSPGDSVQLKQEITTGPDGYAVFRVADGSTFEVYPNSHVTFRNNPGSWKDLLDVWIGRVKVHIQKLGGQPNRNRVTTPTAVISVRGTTFVVDVEDDEATTLVVVEEGQVAVQHALLPRGEPKLVNPGEWLRVYKNQPLARSLDKGSILNTAFRALADALYTGVYRTPRIPSATGGSIPTGGIPGGGGTTPLPGDTTPAPPPPAPPPGDVGGPAPPPPPPPGN